jgi:protein-S-isoprenylcysteine O-methyltransferase Ste14
MPPLIFTLEINLNWLAAIAGLGTLAYSIYNMLLAQRRPTGQYTGAARKILRTRYLIIATLLFLIFGIILWKPLPFQLPWVLGLVVSILGAVVFFASLSLYIWGLRTLGANFNASSGFGVRLNQAHKLVTTGPFAYVRHPMYMAVILAGWSGLALYRTWTMLLFAVIMLGLLFRGRREEEALAQVFGSQWEMYTRGVPGWFPRLDQIFHWDKRSTR